jgi:hypothetical protein
MWIVPSEFSKALDGLAKLGGADGGEEGSWLARTSEVGGDARPIDTAGWFDSNMTPAAEQPEAANIRASDDDPASRVAHEGLAEDPAEPQSFDKAPDGQNPV